MSHHFFVASDVFWITLLVWWFGFVEFVLVDEVDELRVNPVSLLPSVGRSALQQLSQTDRRARIPRRRIPALWYQNEILIALHAKLIRDFNL